MEVPEGVIVPFGPAIAVIVKFGAPGIGAKIAFIVWLA